MMGDGSVMSVIVVCDLLLSMSNKLGNGKINSCRRNTYVNNLMME